MKVLEELLETAQKQDRLFESLGIGTLVASSF